MARKKISLILIVIGLIVMTYPTLTEINRDFQQHRLVKEWENSLDNLESKPLESEHDLAEIKRDFTTPSLNKQIDSMLRIEKINLYLPVLKGANKKNLNTSLASIKGTGKPGEMGNYVIAGHRSHAYGKNFNRLDELDFGDIIEVVNTKSQYKYTVANKFYVDPDEIWILNSKQDFKEITLITCHPMINPTCRLVIKGMLTE